MSGFTIPPVLHAILDSATAVAPGRSKASDGTIGDSAHAARQSDHNPDANGVVHAVDVTHDPVHGFDSYAWADWLRDRCRSGIETRVKYLVSYDVAAGSDRIASPVGAWVWRLKAGRDHANHLHVSVLDGTESSTAPMFVLEEEDPLMGISLDDIRKIVREELATFAVDRGPLDKALSSNAVQTIEGNDRYRKAFVDLCAKGDAKADD